MTNAPRAFTPESRKATLENQTERIAGMKDCSLLGRRSYGKSQPREEVQASLARLNHELARRHGRGRGRPVLTSQASTKAHHTASDRRQAERAN